MEDTLSGRERTVARVWTDEEESSENKLGICSVGYSLTAAIKAQLSIQLPFEFAMSAKLTSCI